MTASTATGGGALDIGRVIQQLFQVLGRNFVPFAVLAVVLAGIPSAIFYSVQMSMLRGGPTAAATSSSVLWMFLGAVVLGLTSLILQATIIHGTVSDLNGRRVSIADSLRAGLYAFLPVLLIGIMMGLAIALGFVLLIVPGVMLAIAWCVAVPVYVVERRGILDVFGRSAELTRGNRWRIFGLAVIYVVAVIIVQMVLGMVGGIANVTAGGASPVTSLFIMPLIQVANALIGASGVAALYVDLRQIKDGIGPEGLAAIFD